MCFYSEELEKKTYENEFSFVKLPVQNFFDKVQFMKNQSAQSIRNTYKVMITE